MRSDAQTPVTDMPSPAALPERAIGGDGDGDGGAHDPGAGPGRGAAPAPGTWTRRGAWFRVVLTLLAVAFLSVFVVVPAANVFFEAFRNGARAYRDVFLPPPADEARLAAIRARLDEIDRMPLAQRRAVRQEQRALLREEGQILAPAERAKKNWSAVRMTLGVAAVVVPLNVLFGLAAAWAVTKFKFPGRSLLVSVIDLPFSVSPVIAGLIFVLLFGAQGFLAAWSKSTSATWLAPAVFALRWAPVVAGAAFPAAWVLGWAARRMAGSDWRRQAALARRARRGVAVAAALVLVGLVAWAYAGPNPGWGWLLPTEWRWPDPSSLYWRGFGAGRWWPVGAAEWRDGVIFTPLAIALASVFVTFPFVARSLIPLMEVQGVEVEQAALTLGASGWQTFWHVTLPGVKWAMLYGAILCTARALGEFGAVSVVSGHLDSNDTMPLRVEKLWQEYKTQPAFTVASLLAMLAVVTLVLKSAIEWKAKRDGTAAAGRPGH